MNKGEFNNILDTIYRDFKQSKEQPMYWNRGGYSFKSDGVNIYIRLEYDKYIPITLSQYNSKF